MVLGQLEKEETFKFGNEDTFINQKQKVTFQRDIHKVAGLWLAAF